ncbi:SDR family oxidoreductase [Actinophytocola sp. NPDC049390]|uniref:SDR family oxidoreductase n=1 Tax=Actinophytocola sp. NPDC049390 TaxID=3363894 RepID=UPI0037898778
MRQHILITGASAGIGAELARQFASAGRSLALCARRLPALEELRAELPGRVLVEQLDVTDADAVFRVFGEVADELGRLDRVIVNAGIGKGAPIGTGGHRFNRETVETNVLGALAQCEAAMEIFRRQNSGHLVVVSSMAALRGLPGAITTYAATKAAVSSLAEGIRVEVAGTPITVTTVLPGYIRSEMNPEPGRLIADTVPAVRAMVAAIEREPKQAYVPPWPWRALAPVLRRMPAWALRKAT